MASDIPEREYYGPLLDNIPEREYMAYEIGNLPIGNIAMTVKNAAEFGALIRQRRRKLGLTQDQLATRCGVGLRFIIELEAGKPSCQLGKALTAAVEVGLHLEDVPPARTSGIGVSAAATEDDPLSQIPSY
jgi:HTH-type transcriptional regulator/antitoxin HipB